MRTTAGWLVGSLQDGFALSAPGWIVRWSVYAQPVAPVGQAMATQNILKRKRITILGSTGSIGCQALEFISSTPRLRACGLAAGANVDLLAEQVRRFGVEAVSLADESISDRLFARLNGTEALKIFVGPSAMSELVRHTRPDVVLSGVIGSAGLEPTLEAIRCRATLAVANKETLVMAGAIIMPAARQAGVSVLPVDSEHSAIFQCLQAGRRQEVRRVVITASGGALRDMDDRQACQATVEQALAHPTWNMGRKITIDSATMMNKALEIVEAYWLFDLQPEQIQVVMHPQSIVHSLVEFCDGSTIAQLSWPDMTLPIAYALCHPQRPDRTVQPLNLPDIGELTFAPLRDRFARAVELGYKVIRTGGPAGAVLNAANESAVSAFLDGRITFGRIVELVEQTLDRFSGSALPDRLDLESLLAADAWARAEVQRELGNHEQTPGPHRTEISNTRNS